MKKLICAASAIAVVAAGLFAAREVLTHRSAPREQSASAGTGNPGRQAEEQPIAIPETIITLKRALPGKDGAGNPAPILAAGTQLVAESTQGLNYIVSRDGHSFRVRCDDAYESHGRFTDGRVEHLALQMASEIRAAGKVPTNERIVSRAHDALEQGRLNASFTDPASLVESLQKALLLHPSAALDAETP